jgi:exodeoxyribonuclease VII large subunit
MQELVPVEENLTPFTVSSYIDYLNTLLITQKVIIRGEVGDKINRYPNFSFFNLKDSSDPKSLLGCFTWNTALNRMGLPLEEGMEVEVVGYSKVREGQLKFQVERISIVGEGALKRLFEYLKQQLFTEGLFDEQYKASLPKFTRKFGLITSGTGRGAKKDFLANLGDYGFDIHFYDVRVEGESAVREIVDAIRWFNENNRGYDVLVLIRGGGSWESLRAFNSEDVARAIFASAIPVIVGCGHEDDLTIACMVSDKRVSTPTAAAQLLNEPWERVRQMLDHFESGIVQSVGQLVRESSHLVKTHEANLLGAVSRVGATQEKLLVQMMANLDSAFNGTMTRFSLLESTLEQNGSKLLMMISNYDAVTTVLEQKLLRNMEVVESVVDKRLLSEVEKLALASPELKLKQGYSITVDTGTGNVVKRACDTQIGSTLKTILVDGSIFSNISEVSYTKEA